MIPGATLRKDPTVKVVGGSEDAYVFYEQPKKFTSDYNMFSNTYPRAWEKNSSFETPL